MPDFKQNISYISVSAVHVYLYRCLMVYNKVYVFVTFIIVKLPMSAADIRISGARSRMDMLPDYFEAAATSKICLSGTRGSA